jgi:hypothetical protein
MLLIRSGISLFLSRIHAAIATGRPYSSEQILERSDKDIMHRLL